MADTLAALDGLLLVVQGRLKAIVPAQLDVHSQGIVQEAAGAELGLAAAPVSTQARLAVTVHLADLVCGLRWAGQGGEGLARLRGLLPNRELRGKQATSPQLAGGAPGMSVHSLQQQGRQPLAMPPQSMSVSSMSLMPLLHVGPKAHTPPRHWLLWQSLSILQPCGQPAGAQRQAQLGCIEWARGWTDIAENRAGDSQQRERTLPGPQVGQWDAGPPPASRDEVAGL